MPAKVLARRNTLLIGTTLLVALGLGYVTVSRATKAFKRTDLTCYLVAAESVLRGGADLYRVTNERGWNYNYPPLFAIVMVPFTKVSLFWASLGWYVISLGLLAWALRMCVAMLPGGPSDNNRWLLYALPPVLMGWPVISALMRGQASVLLMWLVVAAVYNSYKGREMLGAASLAGAIVLKVFPVLLLVYFLWRRQWRLVAGTIAGVALGAFVMPAAVLGWQNNRALLQEWMDVVGKPALNIMAADPESHRYQELLNLARGRNQSLQAILARVLGVARNREIAAGIAVAMLAGTILAGRRAGPRGELLTVSAVVAWNVVTPPVSETHYFVLLLLPLAALVWLAIREDDSTTRAGARVVLLVFAASNLGKPVETYGPTFWGTLVLWAALVTAARRGAMESASAGAGPAAAVP
jgi:hypothetical protein